MHPMYVVTCDGKPRWLEPVIKQNLWIPLAPRDLILTASMLVRATLLFSSQRAAECLLALTNPCWSLPIGCSLVHRGRIESTITLHPAKGEDMATSATTTNLA